MFIKVNNRLLINQFLPGSVCRLCRADSADAILCPACVADLPWLGPACRRCAEALPADGLCPRCQRRPPPFQSCLAPFRYDFPLSELIQQMKFDGQPGLCHALGGLLLSAVRSSQQVLPDALLPMPLHWRRSAARGYNQALELARPLAAALERPLLTELCRRVRTTRPQASLAGRDRRDNVRDAFVLRGSPPARIAIIDDVFTSGHTVTALSRCLLKGGVKRVDVWVLARAGITD